MNNIKSRKTFPQKARITAFGLVLIPMILGMIIHLRFSLSPFDFPPETWEVDQDGYIRIQYIIFILQIILCILMFTGSILWKKHNKSFEIKELVLLLFIVSIMSFYFLASSFPRLPGSRERFRIVECRNNLRKISKTLLSKSNKNNLSLPIKAQSLSCPGSIHDNSYIIFPEIDNEKSGPLIMDYPENHQNVVNVLYANGKVTGLRLNEKQMQTLKACIPNNDNPTAKQLSELREKIKTYSVKFSE